MSDKNTKKNDSQIDTEDTAEESKNKAFDYSYVSTTARIAIYDDFVSAPHILEISPNTTTEFIENLTTSIYSNAQKQGGSIPYTAIREVTENFIHAQFSEIVVSIFNKGRTIRFADQGPGIIDTQKAQLPGFSSATEPMKQYIRGVGSGLPIVKEYLNVTHGNIIIENNISAGAVVTLNQDSENNYYEKHESSQFISPSINFNTHNQSTTQQSTTQDTSAENISLNDKEKVFLSYLLNNGAMRVTDLVNVTESAPSSTHAILKKLENKNLVTHDGNKRRILTNLGISVAKTL